HKLDLIQEDPLNPSFLMYHYPDPELTDAENARPDTWLGERIWTYEPKLSSKEGGKQTVVFSTIGPPGYSHLTLTKIYTLHPKDYHIDLQLEISDDGTAEVKGKKFRYQLAGAHGLPIEGEWYTPTYRNAMIGLVDKSNALWRTFEDATKIN